MKLLSLWEPWATLMALGAKRIETRSWGTSYFGWLAIQAAKHFTADEDDQCWMSPFREVLQAGEIKDAPYRSGRRFQFPLGHIVAVVNLIDCLPTEATGCLSGVFEDYADLDTPQERAFGNYDPDRWAWVTDNLFRLPEPIPFKAKQGLCDVDAATVTLIREQWREQAKGKAVWLDPPLSAGACEATGGS